MEKIKLTYIHEESVAEILMDDGKGNVLDSIMMEDILQCLTEFKTKKNLKLIIFKGQGKHFSFGASVPEHTSEFAETMLKTFHRIFFQIIDLGIPTLAQVSGQCLGGGMELALICNFIMADSSARFGQPEIILGVFPPPASVMLPLKIGYARAEEILLTGKTITAEKAYQIGLVNELYNSQDEMAEGISKWIQENILPKSASSLRYGVKAARVKFNHVMGNFLPQLEYVYLTQLMKSKDANEGINAFLEKRQPVWTDS